MAGGEGRRDLHVVPVGVVIGVGADPGDGDNEEDNGGKDEDAAQGGFVVAETPPCVLPQAASVYLCLFGGFCYGAGIFLVE